MSIQYIVTDTSMTVLLGGVPKVIPNTHPNFEAIEQAVISGGPESKILELIDIAKPVREFVTLDTKGYVTFEHGEVLYRGEAIHSALSRRILGLKDKGFDISPFVNFMENLYENPSNRAVNELYGFLEVCNLPITEDGCFLTYKKITADYLDVYTRTLDNSIGATVEMPRYKVNEDCNVPCSYGLHVASYSYMRSYDGDRIVICKVNPVDVVAVPTDYNNTKMRVCKYKVVNEISMDGVQIEDNAISNKEAYHETIQEDTSVDEDTETMEEPEFYEDCCPECGAENRWNEEEQYCAKCDYSNTEWVEWQEAQGVYSSSSSNSTSNQGTIEGNDPYGENHYEEVEEDSVIVKTDVGGGFYQKTETRVHSSLSELFDNYLDGFDSTKYQALEAFLIEKGINMGGLINTSLALESHTALESKIRNEIKSGNLKKKSLKTFLNS